MLRDAASKREMSIMLILLLLQGGPEPLRAFRPRAHHRPMKRSDGSGVCLNCKFDHIELHVPDAQILPITETGYKSHFLSYGIVAKHGGYEQFVRAWLDHAADSADWKARMGMPPAFLLMEDNGARVLVYTAPAVCCLAAYPTSPVLRTSGAARMATGTWVADHLLSH